MLDHAIGIKHCVFMRIFNYDGSCHGEQNLYCYILALCILDSNKRNLVSLPLGIHSI